jgi:exodeoxyribonuclease-5
MIDTHLGGDLIATGARVTTTGDPGQLPPVRGQRYFQGADFTLKHIHRQALESAIIRQAHKVRNEGFYTADGPDFRVSNYVSAEDFLAADVILCWKNQTRRHLNGLARAHRGFSGPPLKGEPVMCLRNDHQKAVMNGAVYQLLTDYDPAKRQIVVVNERNDVVTLGRIHMEDFDAPPGQPDDPAEVRPFTLAYAATVHKFQGSEIERGILIDEYSRSDFRREWLYTGITRFSKQILIYNSDV